MRKRKQVPLPLGLGKYTTNTILPPLPSRRNCLPYRFLTNTFHLIPCTRNIHIAHKSHLPQMTIRVLNAPPITPHHLGQRRWIRFPTRLDARIHDAVNVGAFGDRDAVYDGRGRSNRRYGLVWRNDWFRVSMFPV